jgi:arylsulfatase A-like enzyme
LGSAEAGGEPVSSEYLTDLASGRAQADSEERARIVSLYDAEIAEVDESIGELLDGMAERGYVDPVVALVSDHGEEFGEHERWFHAIQLHAESVSVPIVLSGGAVARALSDEPVDLLDVPATLMRLADVVPAPGSRGRNLLAAPPARDIVAELHPDPPVEQRVGTRKHRLAVLRWPWKGIVDRDGSARLYDLSADPAERRPFDIDAPSVPRRFGERVRELERSLVSGEEPPPSATLSETDEEGLRALGYIE